MKMVRLTSIMLLLMLISMCVQFSSCDKEVKFVDQQPDTIYVEVPVYIEVPTNNGENEKLKSKISDLEKDVDYLSVKTFRADSALNRVEYENYMNARKVERINYYILITEKNPKNKQFFYGWIKRVMAEQ